ncbi:hypothetical protein EVAR_21473_1 [Eumeta japonica]|uniref:Uncharacterized protein n=1 Tax=Eumeta variegata TaxID=151549 RepID=A0A4C1ZJS5_EUMVA|nr:hypothetical protein EVAR_21473_1 [Eumeta japonica]
MRSFHSGGRNRPISDVGVVEGDCGTTNPAFSNTQDRLKRAMLSLMLVSHAQMNQLKSLLRVILHAACNEPFKRGAGSGL